MQRAQRRGAVTRQKFFFRKRIYPADTPPLSHSTSEVSTPSKGSPPYVNGLDIGGRLANISNGIEANGGGDVEHVYGHESQGSDAGSELPSSRDPPQSVAQSRCPSPPVPDLLPIEEEYEQMTMAEIIIGKVRAVRFSA